MLTLRGAGYTHAELKTLRSVVEVAQHNIIHVHPCRGVCENCDVRHACGDLARLHVYLDKEIKRRDPADIDAHAPHATP